MSQLPGLSTWDKRARQHKEDEKNTKIQHVLNRLNPPPPPNFVFRSPGVGFRKIDYIAIDKWIKFLNDNPSFVINHSDHSEIIWPNPTTPSLPNSPKQEQR